MICEAYLDVPETKAGSYREIDRERERDSADDLWCLQMNNSKVLFQGSKTFRLTICTSQAVLGSMEAIPGARPIRICSP